MVRSTIPAATEMLKVRSVIGGLSITRCSASSEQRHKIAQDLLDFRAGWSVCSGRLGEATTHQTTTAAANRRGSTVA